MAVNRTAVFVESFVKPQPDKNFAELEERVTRQSHDIDTNATSVSSSAAADTAAQVFMSHIEQEAWLGASLSVILLETRILTESGSISPPTDVWGHRVIQTSPVS